MKLVYEGVNITNDVDIHTIEFTDNAGNIADSLEVRFDDPKNQWSEWNPQKNHKISINDNGLNSGIMYVDEIEQLKGMYVIRALSIPQEAKTCRSQAWESIRFLEFSAEIASKYGFSLETYGIENYLYNRVEQFDEADFSFLARRCTLEGYVLKLTDNKAVIYSESYLEALSSDKTMSMQDFDGGYKFLCKSTGIYSSCKLSYTNLTAAYTPGRSSAGAVLRKNVYFSSQGEGNRFAQNILRAYNKYETTGSFTVKLDTEVSAGSNITIDGKGLADGNYFCEKVIHKFSSDSKTHLIVRKPLEVY